MRRTAIFAGCFLLWFATWGALCGFCTRFSPGFISMASNGVVRAVDRCFPEFWIFRIFWYFGSYVFVVGTTFPPKDVAGYGL